MKKDYHARSINGCAVCIQRSPDKDGSWVTTSCELPEASHYQCRYAMAYEMPMKPGMRCIFNDGGDCMQYGARIHALELAATLANDERRKLEREQEAE